jgi:enterochelin esterase family protein
MMNRIRKWIMILGIIPGTLAGQTFNDLIIRLNSLPVNERQVVVDSFMNAAGTFPFLESDTLCHFIYTGTASSASVAGDFTYWNPNWEMTQIIGTNFWYRDAIFEDDARLDYKFVLNGSSWILDPRNPNTCTGGFGPNSELRMPAYTIPPEISYYPGIPHGTLVDTVFYSNQLGNSRTVKIYLPPGYSSDTTEYPVILFHDGLEYISLANANNVLDYLIGQREIQPVIGVFVPPVNRTDEYAGAQIDAFTYFITGVVMPEIDRKYRTSGDPRKRATLGASNGGNISLYLGMKHPEAFGKIAAQSSNVQTIISSTFQYGNKLDLEFYLDIGTYDIPVLIPLVEGLVQILQNRGYAYQYYQWHEGHSWGNWKGHLRLPLQQFFPSPAGFNERNDEPRIRLFQNAPNPFSDETFIRFAAPVGSQAELILFDNSGRKLATVFKGEVSAGLTTVLFRNPGYSSGIYFYSLKADSRIESCKMNIIQ